MADVRFYHLLRNSLEDALPKLLERIVALPARAVLLVPDEGRAEALAAHLWTYNRESFLPHGTRRDGNAARQPLYLTSQPGNPNGSTALVLVDGVDSPPDGYAPAGFSMIFDIFDGRDDLSVQAARNRYRANRQAGHSLKYFQQTDSGWEQKA